MTQQAIRRALISVYDKTGLDELGRGLAEAGVEIVSTGSTAAPIAAAGVPVTAGRGRHRLPRVPDGRVKTLHPKVHAGLLADLRQARAPGAARRARHRAVRPGGGQPLPVHRDRRVRRVARGVHRADRHRRSGDGAGRGEEPRQRRGGRRTRPYDDVAGRAWRPAASPWSSAGGWRRRRSCTRRPTTWRSRPGCGSVLTDEPSDGTGVPELDRRSTWDQRQRCCATARTRTSAPRSTGQRAPAAGLAEARAAARQGDVLQQLRRRRRRPRGPPTTSTEPASRSSSTPTRAASRSATTSPRRTARRTPATRCRRSAG